MRELSQFVLELVNTHQQTYSIYMEESEADLPEVVIMSICDGRTLCFHIAITCTNTNIENAKVVCSQAVLHRSTGNDPLLYFAVFDRHTQVLYLCLLDPQQQTFEDVAQFQMPWQETQATRLQAYVACNAEVLR
jgi:hypothetical protein